MKARRRQTKNAVTLTLGLVAAALLATATAPSARSDDQIIKPYDWTVELKAKNLEHSFEYQNSQLHGVQELQVTYVHSPDTTHPADTQPQDFERLWFHEGKPLGLERKHSFDVNQGDGVSILVSFKETNPTAEEYKAAANGILRVILDSYLNKNAVVTIRVPPDGLSLIQQALRDEGCLDNLPVDEEQQVATAINLFLQTEPDASQTAIMYYI